MATSTRRTTTTARTASPCVASQHQESDEKLLTDLFNAYYQARKNKRTTHSQMRFEQNLSKNLITLYDEIRARRYHPGRSMCFIIRDPVQREVFSASFRDRIVHHLLFNYLNPLFEPLFIPDSYSCRVGKGTHYGIRRMSEQMALCISGSPDNGAHVLKLDISGYFMSIDRNVLFNKIIPVVRQSSLDFNLVEYLLRQIVFNDPTAGCRIRGCRSDWDGLPLSKSLFHSPPGCGLPIGNLTSQLFSNVYLSSLDEYVIEELGFRFYGRYVDDFYLIDSSKERLLAAVPKIRAYLVTELRLHLHPRKVYLQDVRKGAPFLGCWVFPGKSFLTHRAAHRLRRHMCDALTYEENPFRTAAVLRSCIWP